MSIRQLQCLLAYLGYYDGQADGIWGAGTAAGVRRFQKEQGLTADGLVSPGLEEKLRQAVASDRTGEDWWQGIRWFKREEFRCRCGKCGGFPAEPARKLVQLEDQVRAHFGRPIYNSSGVRCPTHNARVGGVANSRHLTGCAVDFTVAGVSADKVLAYVRTLPATAYAYKIDDGYVHMDVVG